MKHRLNRLGQGGMLILMLAAGCTQPTVREIVETRQVPAATVAIPAGSVSTPERMGLAAPAVPRDRLPVSPETSVVPDADTGNASLTWTLPEGWRELPPRPMRLASFAVGDAECYIAVLAGDGGGIAANINRWRRQMGLDPLDDAAIQALPTLTVLGGPAAFVAMEGTYRDMNGNTLEQAGVLGVVRDLDGRTLFIRMTGPAATVRAHQAEFRAFCESLRERPAS